MDDVERWLVMPGVFLLAILPGLIPDVLRLLVILAVLLGPPWLLVRVLQVRHVAILAQA